MTSSLRASVTDSGPPTARMSLAEILERMFYEIDRIERDQREDSESLNDEMDLFFDSRPKARSSNR